MVGHNPRRRRVLRVKTLGRSAPESVTLKRPHSNHAHVCGLVQSRVTTDLVCAMVCASEGNVSKRRGRPWEFDLRIGLRLVCALVCARHTGRSANQIKYILYLCTQTCQVDLLFPRMGIWLGGNVARTRRFSRFRGKR